MRVLTGVDSVRTIIDALRSARRILVTTHARADPDAIGSTAGLVRALTAQGKDAVGYLHEAPSGRYAFMLEQQPLSIWRADQAAAVLAGADLLVIVDTCARSQLGDVTGAIDAATLSKIAIDHHQTRDDVVQTAWVEPGAAATAQLITRLCDEAGWGIDRATAELLFIGLAGDTGWFRFSNAGTAAYSTAARLVSTGVAVNELYERLFLSDLAPRARLVGAVLSSFELHADGRLAVVRMTREMLRTCGASDDMSEDLVNEPMRIERVMAAALLAETPNGEVIRVSLRSKRDVDVAAIAARFGGGGHTRAAGVRMNGTIEAAVGKIVPAMVAAIESADRP